MTFKDTQGHYNCYY